MNIRKKTVKRFEEWSKDEKNLEDLLTRISEGGRLEQACKQINQPYRLVSFLLNTDQALKARFELAKKQFADRIHERKLELADQALKADEPVKVMGIRVAKEIWSEEAKAWNPDRYDEKRAPLVQVNLSLVDVAREIRDLEQKLGIFKEEPKVIEATPLLDSQ